MAWHHLSHVCAIALAVCISLAESHRVTARAPVPEDQSEWWVAADVEVPKPGPGQEKFQVTESKRFLVRVQGGPVEQVSAGRTPPISLGSGWDLIPKDPHAQVPFLAPNGKMVVYTVNDPAVKVKPEEYHKRRALLMVAEGKFGNARQLFSGLSDPSNLSWTKDSKAVVCFAEKDGEWHLYKVPVDGTPPTKLSKRPSLGGGSYQELNDGKFVYCVGTGSHDEKVPGYGISRVGKGDIILSEPTGETVLFKDTVESLSCADASPDARKAARGVIGEKGGVLEVLDIKSGGVDRIPISVFNPDWKCRFGPMCFRPDGKAIATRFSLGHIIIRDNGKAMPGDECIEHFGVVWLDGRKDKLKLFRVQAPPRDFLPFGDIRHLEWSRGPEAKK
ncbi:MAG TPA: hypothetical protein VKE74_14395 [Gemmataceae bacterium]|nr:hypothetical protein [Gemmataceae bacterium]